MRCASFFPIAENKEVYQVLDSSHLLDLLDFSTHFFICCLLVCPLIGLLAGFKRLFKNYLSARMQYRLWLVLLILLAVPFLPVGSFDLAAKAQPAPSNTTAQQPALTKPIPSVKKVNDFAVSVSRRTPSVIQVVFLALWCAGMFVMGVLIFRSWNWLHAVKKSALPLQSAQVKAIFKECQLELGIQKNIPVYSTAFLKSPMIAGFLRPGIYLPIHLISDFHPEELRFMLLHELQHYRHKDMLIGYWMTLTGIVYWFHPLVGYALKEMRCEREIACDCAVLQILEESDYQAYGHTLINFAEKISRFSFPFAAEIGGSTSQIKRRILNIAGFHKETSFRNVRGVILSALLAVLLMSCAPVLFTSAFASDDYRFQEYGKNISELDLSKAFQGYTGSFVLYDTSSDSWSMYNKKNAAKRVTPNSTYKIYDALLGLESGVITAEHSHMAWNRKPYPYDSWEADQDLNSAMRNSVNWYFQAIDAQADWDSIKAFLQKIEYGNQQIGSDLELYWTDFSLKISPIEQIELLKKFHDNAFSFEPQNIAAVKDAIRLSSTKEGSFYGKTGTGRVDGRDVNGWFIGYVEKAENVYYFAANIQGEAGATGSRAAAITASVLSDLQIWSESEEAVNHLFYGFPR